MSSKNCPETPRQKMINMMYLVLTAMLALNVASETLDAFKVVDASLFKTYLSFTDKNNTLIDDFKQAYDVNQVKVEKWYDLAKEVQSQSDSLIHFIIDVKEELALASGSHVKLPEEELRDEFPFIIINSGDTISLNHQDDLNTPPNIMIVKGRGKEIQKKVGEYKTYLESLVDKHPEIINNLEASLDVSDPKKKVKEGGSWVQQNFESIPLVASITLLSKLQIDVRNAESAVLRHLFNQIDAASFKFTGLRATVIPEASYVFQGQDYKARIFLSAEDTTQNLEVFVNGSTTPLKTEGNEAIYSFTANEPGEYTYKGQIKYRNPDGDGYNYATFEQAYQVAKPTATISATKMNVLFKGLDNPIDISVPGVPSNKIEPICTNGTIEKVGNSWIVKPEELDLNEEKTKIEVYAETGGQRQKMYEASYRVMRVPNPTANVSGLSSGEISKKRLDRQTIVSADMENFYFKLEYQVSGFALIVPKGSYIKQLRSNSNAFTEEMKAAMSALDRGDKIIIEDIMAKRKGDTTGEVSKLNSIVLTIK